MLTVKRVGAVAIKVAPERGNQFYLEWLSKPGTRIRLKEACGVFADRIPADVRKTRIPADVLDLAKRKNHEVSGEHLQHIDTAGKYIAEWFTVADAMQLAIDKSPSQSAHHRKNMAANKDRFIAWVEKEKGWKRPLWSGISVAVAEEYAEWLIGRGISTKTVKHYLSILILASRQAVKKSPKEFFVLSGINPELTKEPKAVKNYLDTSEILALVDYMKQHDCGRWSAELVILSGLVGLNVMEVARLKKSSYCPVSGTLTVGESKNDYRTGRVLPLPKAVNEWCRVAFGRLPGPDALLISLQNSEEIKNYGNIGHQLMKALFEPAVKAGAIKRITAKELRKTAANLPVGIVNSPYDKAYFGWTDGSVAQKVYQEISNPDKLRKHFVEPMEKHYPWLADKNFLKEFCVTVSQQTRNITGKALIMQAVS